MSETIRITDADEARRVLAEGLWLGRLAVPGPGGTLRALALARDLLAEGEAVPPVGLLADVRELLLGAGETGPAAGERRDVPGLPAGLLRQYEDLVVGRLEAGLGSARDALVRYRGAEADRERALAFVVRQVRSRVGFAGVEVNPAVARGLADLPAHEALALGWHSLAGGGAHPALVRQLESLVGAFRMAADVLAPEDVFELESGTAVAEFGERVALRQLLEAARALGGAVRRPRAPARRAAREAPTRLQHEDAYPVGGFSSLSTRGSLESLLHSQLVYMDPADRPDLFDIKYVRDELLYYARDENEFLRQRLSYVVAVHPSLVLGRVKDRELPYQRGLLALAVLVALVRRLAEWCGTEALQFRLAFLAVGEQDALAAERALLELVLREEAAKGLVQVLSGVTAEGLAADWEGQRRRAHCRGLLLTVAEGGEVLPDEGWLRLVVDGAAPRLDGGAVPAREGEEDSLAGWVAVLQAVLDAWI